MPTTLDSSTASGYERITVDPVTPIIGAEIGGVDLDAVDDATFAEIERAFAAHLVVFFRDQHLSPEQHKALGRRLGELHVHPAAPTLPGHPEVMIVHADERSKVVAGNGWHTDVSCDERPPLGTILYLKQLPPAGGDTLFASMYAAYDDLSAPMKAFLEPLSAKHESRHVYAGRYGSMESASRDGSFPEAIHPVVRTHPVTGRKALYVNRAFTTRIVGLAPSESRAVLDLLFALQENPKYQCRFRWQASSVAMWDNRCAQHHAIWDYFPQVRSGVRVSITGEHPVWSGPAPAPSREEIGLFAFQVWSYKQGEMVALLIHLGDRLGLYRAMAGAGPLRASELVERTGLHERWVTEWLRGNGAAGLLSWDHDDRFELTAAGAAVLADEEGSLFFAAGAFGSPPSPDYIDDLADAFRSGLGLPYDRQGPAGVHRTERMLGPWTRLALVPRIVPTLDGVEAALDGGGVVADVGCGAGVAVVALAQRFPHAEIHGYDISRHAIERAGRLAADAGVENVRLHHAGAESLPDQPTFDFVLTLDCLHDMTRPDESIAAIRRSIAHDGTWLIKDIRCAPVARSNLTNPMAAMMYGFSIASCMSSALSEPGGAGLGTLGLHPELLARLCAQAGFSRFQIHDFDEPANLYYEVRS